MNDMELLARKLIQERRVLVCLDSRKRDCLFAAACVETMAQVFPFLK
jgi:hypothetical protein